MALYTKIKGDASYVEMGSPTILDGIISGFSTSNYLKLPTFAPGNKSWELKLKFLSNNAGTTQAIVRLNTGTGDYGGMLIGMNANNRLWWNIGSSGTSWFQTNPTIDPVLTNNTWYEILVKYDGSKYTLSIINNGVATVAYTNNTATPIYQQGDTTIGARVTGTTNYFRGSVDLNNTYIKIENTVWFGTSFSKVKVNTGLIKYTVVGSPTITSDGIASNFSASNYLTLPELNSQGLKKIEFGFCLVNVGGQNYRQYLSMTGLSLCISNGGGVGINYGGSSYYNWNTPPSTGEVLIKSILDIENSKLIISWTSDGETYKTSTHQLSSTISIDSIVNIGKGSMSIIEAINLKKSYIKINDGYFWKGFNYQNINSWKIQQDNFSKYYTIVDGKLMWANPSIYLESSGTQYIDTGIKGNLETAIELKYQFTQISSTSGTGRIFGARKSGRVNAFMAATYLGTTQTTDRYGCGFNQTGVDTSKYVDLNTNIIKLSKEGYYINSTKYNFDEVATQEFTTPQNLLIFAYYQSSEIRGGSLGRCYYCKLWENNELIRHFVPVPKGLLIGNFVVPNNGMFDIVNQQFYGNSGTGEFTIGGIPQDYIIEGGKMIWCNPDISLVNNSNWSAYINTGIIPTDDMRFQTLSEVTDSASHDGCLLGCRVNASAGTAGKQFVLWYGNYSSNINSGSFVYGGSASGNCNFNLGTLQKTQLNYDGTYFYCNGTSITPGSSNVNKSNFSSTLPIYLFGFSANGSIESRRFHGKVYEVALWSGSTILQYLVPVPKGMLIGDKIAPSNCMFDMVTQTFFENQGTGTFVIGGLSGDYIDIGDNIVWVDNNVYLKCNGAQYFDSDFKANQDTKVDVDYTPMESGVMTVYCCRDGLRSNTFTCFSPVSGTSSTRYDYNTTQNTISSNPVAGTRRHIVADKNKFYIDDVLKYTATYSNFQANNTMIFGCSNANGYDNYSKFKYHKIQLYNNSKLIHYFLPVNTNTTIGSFTVPAPGMWDAVTKKFYPNKGTGAFTYGKDS